MRLCLILLTLGTTFWPTVVLGQTAVAKTTSPLVISDRALRDMSGAPPAATQGGTRDSLKNGAIIGALVGAAGFAVSGAVVCKMLQEPSDPSCVPGVLVFAAIGAGIGGAAGVGIDALIDRSPRGLNVRVRGIKRW